jgi:hypothetical protein
MLLRIKKNAHFAQHYNVLHNVHRRPVQRSFCKWLAQATSRALKWSKNTSMGGFVVWKASSIGIQIHKNKRFWCSRRPINATRMTRFSLLHADLGKFEVQCALFALCSPRWPSMGLMLKPVQQKTLKWPDLHYFQGKKPHRAELGNAPCTGHSGPAKFFYCKAQAHRTPLSPIWDNSTSMRGAVV